MAEELGTVKRIYNDIIIKEIFNIENLKYSKKIGNEDFSSSKEKIIKEILNRLEQKYSEEKMFYSHFGDYNNRYNNFIKSFNMWTSQIEDDDIYYKSSLLKNRSIDEYIKIKEFVLIDLNSCTHSDFKEKEVYKYRSECTFESAYICGQNMIRVGIVYDENKIKFLTSASKWICLSIIANYLGKSRFCTCYFILEKGKFIVLQIGDD